jgi:hypothetical protein
MKGDQFYFSKFRLFPGKKKGGGGALKIGFSLFKLRRRSERTQAICAVVFSGNEGVRVHVRSTPSCARYERERSKQDFDGFFFFFCF